MKMQKQLKWNSRPTQNFLRFLPVSYTHLDVYKRQAWKQLIADIEAGKVAHVIVKDMSRAGRDYLQTG